MTIKNKSKCEITYAKIKLMDLKNSIVNYENFVL